jgi:hypothetical protein
MRRLDSTKFSSGGPLGPTKIRLGGFKYSPGHAVLKDVTVVALVITCCIFGTGWADWNFVPPGSFWGSVCLRTSIIQLRFGGLSLPKNPRRLVICLVSQVLWRMALGIKSYPRCVLWNFWAEWKLLISCVVSIWLVSSSCSLSISIYSRWFWAPGRPRATHKASETPIFRLLGDSIRKGPGRNTLGRSWECSKQSWKYGSLRVVFWPDWVTLRKLFLTPLSTNTAN